MNLFFLEHDTTDCAQAHVDRHVVKMITESAQMLSTALLEHGMFDDSLMKRTHLNHPMCVWVRETRANFLWTLSLMVELISEADYRFGAIKRDGKVKYERARKIAQACVALNTCVPVGDGMTPPPQCMPPDFRGPDTVEAYRTYYRAAKRDLAKWTKRPTPTWWS